MARKRHTPEQVIRKLRDGGSIPADSTTYLADSLDHFLGFREATCARLLRPLTAPGSGHFLVSEHEGRSAIRAGLERLHRRGRGEE